MDQKKFRGNLLDSLPSQKVTLTTRLLSYVRLWRVMRRIKKIRKMLDQYQKLQDEHFNLLLSLSEDTPKGTSQKVGVEK